MTTLHTALHALPTVLRAEADGWNQTWTLPEDFPAFNGHFPGFPLLPAVVQMHMALEVMAAAQNAPLPRLLEVTSAKFMAPVRPLQAVTVTVRPVPSAAEQGQARPAVWDAVVTCEAVVAAKCRLQVEWT